MRALHELQERVDKLPGSIVEKYAQQIGEIKGRLESMESINSMGKEWVSKEELDKLRNESRGCAVVLSPLFGASIPIGRGGGGQLFMGSGVCPPSLYLRTTIPEDNLGCGGKRGDGG